MGRSVADLTEVIYSCGKVFDGLATGRAATENFLRTGSPSGITSRSDLELLEDLRDAAQFIVDHTAAAIDATYVRTVNAQITRSGALHPGQLRTPDQRIGVHTRSGRHEPPALTYPELQQLIAVATTSPDATENALELFVQLAAAQPFEDGNKRTALFAANGVLITTDTGLLLAIPVDDRDPRISDQFNDALAHAYIHDAPTAVKDTCSAARAWE